MRTVIRCLPSFGTLAEWGFVQGRGKSNSREHILLEEGEGGGEDLKHVQEDDGRESVEVLEFEYIGYLDGWHSTLALRIKLGVIGVGRVETYLDYDLALKVCELVLCMRDRIDNRLVVVVVVVQQSNELCC